MKKKPQARKGKGRRAARHRAKLKARVFRKKRLSPHGKKIKQARPR